MALEDDLKARASALISQQMANWVVEIQRSIQGHQASLVRALDELGEDVARYDERIDEEQIEAAMREAVQQAGPVAGGADYASLKSSIAGIERGTNLSEVLTHLVNEANHHVERAAMFIVKSQSAVGWYASGVENPEVVKTITVPLSGDTIFRLAANSRQAERGHITHTPGTAEALGRLGGTPQGILAIPLILRDKVAAILYCDSSADEIPQADADAAEILVAFAAKVIDVLSAAPRGQAGPGTSPGGRAPAPAPASAPPAAAPAPAPAPAAPPPGGDASAQTVMFGTGTMRAQATPPAPRPGTTPTGEVVAPPAPAAPPPPAAPEVRAMSPEEQKAHDDARRFARLVVSEIKLYNEAKVSEGRQTRDIYERLKEDIERGRQMYNDRVGTSVRETTDYFQDELVRILGGGDAAALGPQ
ncbi:MAG: GAF domain-containing protein [Acidobacteria bacterium]|nr:GAF domain-containing protein [Acidobacteriota bacterium]